MTKLIAFLLCAGLLLSGLASASEPTERFGYRKYVYKQLRDQIRDQGFGEKVADCVVAELKDRITAAEWRKAEDGTPPKSVNKKLGNAVVVCAFRYPEAQPPS